MRSQKALVHVPGLGASRGDEQMGQSSWDVVKQLRACRQQWGTADQTYADMTTAVLSRWSTPMNRGALLMQPGHVRAAVFTASLASRASCMHHAVTKQDFPKQSRLRSSVCYQRVARDIHDQLVGKSESVTRSRRLALQYIRSLHPDKFRDDSPGPTACVDTDKTRSELLHLYMQLVSWLDDPEIGAKICGETAFDTREAAQVALRAMHRRLGPLATKAVLASSAGVALLLGGIALRIFVHLGGLNYVAICWATYALESRFRTIRKAQGAAALVWDNPRFVSAVTLGVVAGMAGAGTAAAVAGLPFGLIGL